MKLFTSGLRTAIVALALILFISHTSSAQCGLTVSLTSSAGTCAGTDTLVLTGASSAVQIVWQSAGTTATIDSAGGTIDTTYIPAVGGTYVAIVTAPGGCLDTSSATVVDTVVTPSVSISTGHSHTICYGTIITFTAHPVNGGASPSYQWYVTGVPTDTGATFVDSTLQNADSVWVVMMSSATCTSVDTVMSNVIPYVVNPVVTPTVTISSTNTGDTICQNTVVNLLAIGTNGGTNPDYQWQQNGINVGNSNTYIANPVLNGDVFRCILTSTAPCPTQQKDTSAAITFTVDPYPAVTIVSSSPTHTVCASDTVTLTATGGSRYSWSTGDTTAAIRATGGTYSVTATSSYGCTAATAPLTLAPLPPTVDSIYRRGDSLVSGSSEFYQWYYNGAIISGAISPVYVPAANGSYQVAVVDSFGCIDYSAVVLIAPAGITAITSGPQVRMYPVPNSGIFTLEIGDDAPHQVSITDAMGSIVADHITVTGHKQFDLSSLTDGMYYLQVDGRVVKFTVVK